MMIDNLYVNIGKRIKELRTKKNMTQLELSEKTNLGRSSIANIESGRQKVSIDALYKIAYILEEEVQYVLPEFSELSEEDFLDIGEAHINAELQFLRNILSKNKEQIKIDP